MPLTQADRERARFHLGYLDVSSAASLSYGIPAARQTLFIVELAMSNVLEVAIPRVLRILGIMDGIEQKLVDAQDRMVASSVNGIKMRENETDALEREYVRFGYRLADLMGCAPYMYSRRYMDAGGVSAGCIPVRS